MQYEKQHKKQMLLVNNYICFVPTVYTMQSGNGNTKAGYKYIDFRNDNAII